MARHEFGHAVDRALVGRTSNDGIKHLPYDREVFSNQTEFVSAFDNDALKVEALLTTSNQIGALVHKDREYLDYFMPKPNGDFKSDFTMKARRELLAEMFAVICEEKYNENGVNISPLRKHHTDLLKNLFPETYLVVLKAVEDMKQGTQKKS